jgi:hypothetical protein
MERVRNHIKGKNSGRCPCHAHGQYHLTTTVLMEIVLCLCPVEKGTCDPYQVKLDGRYSHIDQIRERLYFLRFLLKVQTCLGLSL